MPDAYGQRVLHDVDVVAAPRAISPPASIDDPAVQALVQRSVEAARVAGMQEGLAQGRAQADQAAASLAASIERAVHQAAASSAAIADHLAARITGLAVEIASRVVADLDPSGTGIVARVDEALHVLDDRPLVVHVHRDDLALVQAACPPEVEAVVEASLQPGEARIEGRWADADLTWNSIWGSVREVLDAE